MEAKEYLKTHWYKNKLWTHVEYPKHQERLKKCANMVIGDTFVDVGCALGHSTKTLKKFYPGKWSGIDFCENTIKDAIKTFPDISFEYAENIQDVKNKYDSIVCSEVIEHVKDDKNFVIKLWDMTNKKLILTTPSKRVEDPGHLRLYDEVSLKILFDFIEVLIEENNGFWYISCIKSEK